MVVQTVLRRSLIVSALGIAIGIAAAPLLGRLVSGLLYGVSPFDPVTYGVQAIVLLGVAAGAAYLSARRAARVDPVRVLKDE